MENMIVVKELEIGKVPETEKLKDVKEIFNGAHRRIVEVTLRNNETLSKHKASESITVLCLGGSGTFRAGADLEDSYALTAGTLITLERQVEHEVTAEPWLHLLVTKFKEN